MEPVICDEVGLPVAVEVSTDRLLRQQGCHYGFQRQLDLRSLALATLLDVSDVPLWILLARRHAESQRYSLRVERHRAHSGMLAQDHPRHRLAGSQSKPVVFLREKWAVRLQERYRNVHHEEHTAADESPNGDGCVPLILSHTSC